MGFDFSYNFSPDSFESVFFGAMAGVAVIAALIALLFWLIKYILMAWGTYSIARRRGVRHAWLAWVPVARHWLLGCISDQFQYVVRGKVRYNRIVLLVLALMRTVVGSWVTGHMLRMAWGFGAFGPAAAGVFLDLLGGCIALAAFVFHMIAMYDLYASCTPDNKVLFLVLSIFLPVTEPFFVIAIHGKDLGMPPRKSRHEEPQSEQPQTEQY